MRRGNKYGAKKTVVDGIKFDSKCEAERYGQLKLLEKAGEISGIELQVKEILQEGFKGSDGKKVRAIHYVADFRYREGDNIIIEDAKGIETDVFKLKWKMMKHKYKEQGCYILRLTFKDGRIK